MCKLFAWQGNGINRNIEKLIKGLLVAETFKNSHGTGIFVVSKSGKKKLLKRGYDAVSLLIRDAENLSYTLYDAKFVMGHVRYATHGSPKKRNSHPFVFTRVVGCHNGVLNYDELVCLAKEEKIKKLDEVDSKLFFRILNYYLKKYSLVESLKKILKRVSGDYTFLIYYNDELYFIRNSGRPLFLFDMRNKGMGVFLASTEEMWKKACKIAGSFAGIKNQAVEVKPDVLYKLSSEGELVEVAKIKGKKKEKRSVKQFSYSYYLPAYNGYYEEDDEWDKGWEEALYKYYSKYREEFEGVNTEESDKDLEIERIQAEIEDLLEYKVYLEDRIYMLGDANAYDEYCAVLDELKKKKKKLRELENKFYSLQNS